MRVDDNGYIWEATPLDIDTFTDLNNTFNSRVRSILLDTRNSIDWFNRNATKIIPKNRRIGLSVQDVYNSTPEFLEQFKYRSIKPHMCKSLEKVICGRTEDMTIFGSNPITMLKLLHTILEV